MKKCSVLILSLLLFVVLSGCNQTNTAPPSDSVISVSDNATMLWEKSSSTADGTWSAGTLENDFEFDGPCTVYIEVNMKSGKVKNMEMKELEHEKKVLFSEGNISAGAYVYKIDVEAQGKYGFVLKDAEKYQGTLRVYSEPAV